MNSQKTTDVALVHDVVMRLRRLSSGFVGTISSHHCPLLNDSADAIEFLLDLLERAKPIVEQDAVMMADLTRHAPLPPEAQAKHDSTEHPSERWLADLDRFMTA
jgi:hypothetical protein